MHAADSAFGAANCMNTIAEIARRRGDVAGATAVYEQSLALSSSLGLLLRHVVRLNLALLLVEQGRRTEGKAQLLQSLRVSKTMGLGVLDYGARAGLLVCAIEAGDLASWDEHLLGLAALDDQIIDDETATWVLRAADLARAAGEEKRADAAVALAGRLRRRLA
jgi:hypothetical protein